MSDRPICVTGATGFLGSHFLLKALGQERAMRAICVGRAPSDALFRTRLRAALRIAATSYRASTPIDDIVARCSFVAGDLSQENLGISARIAKDIAARRPTDFWHFAASLKYEDKHRAEIEAANVDGVRRTLQLADHVGADRFVHISTAYVNGAASGPVSNTVNGTGRFNNVYESSKHAAETLVLGAGMPTLILRPSIVVGNSESADPAGSTTGFYGLLGELRRASRLAERASARIRLPVDPDAAPDFIPVDLFTRDILAAGRNPSAPPIMNITSGGALPMAVLEPVVHAAGATRIDFCDRPANPSRLERALTTRTAFFTSYIGKPGLRFFRTAPGRADPSVDDLIAFARAWRAQLPECGTVPQSAPLHGVA